MDQATDIGDQAGDIGDQTQIGNNQIVLAPALFWAVCMALGFALCFWGYKFVRPSLAAMGFVVGGLLCGQIAEDLFNDNQAIMLVSFVLCGALIAMVVWQLYEVGVFLAGVWGGYVLASLIFASIVVHLHSHTLRIAGYYLMVILLGALGGFLAIKVEKPAMILATSFVGAQLAVQGAGFFVGGYPSRSAVNEVYHTIKEGDTPGVIPGTWILYVIATVILAIIGVFVQFRYTAVGVNHAHYRRSTRFHFQDNAEAVPIIRNGDGYQTNAPEAKGQPIHLA